MEIRDILENMGYSLIDDGKYWRTNSVYRDGDNKTALRISKETGSWIDFVTNETGSLAYLISRTKGIPYKEAKKYVSESSTITNPNSIKQRTQNIIAIETKFSSESLINLKPDHSYWIRRGISYDTLKMFRGGLCIDGKLKDRYVIPIFNERNEIVGLQGRTLKDSDLKYKTLGRKKFFLFPYNLNRSYIEQSRQVILVEGVGCVLSLWESGIKNSICLFGTELSNNILNFIIQNSLRIDDVCICLNNDKSKVGQQKAQKIYEKMNKFLPNKARIIFPPSGKDFNESLCTYGKKQILSWAREHKIFSSP